MDVSHELKMNLSRREIRVLLLRKLRLGCRAMEANNNMYGVMDDDVISIHTAQHWFNCFKNGNLELEDLPHSCRSLEVDVDLPKRLIEEDFRLTSLYLAEQLWCSHTVMEKHLNKLGKTCVLVPHELSPHQL